MWTCKHCGQEVETNVHECWNCGTGINWVPPTEAPVFPFEQETTLPPKTAPLSSDLAGALSALGIAVGIIGAFAGTVVLFNSPEAPSAYSTDPLSDIQRVNRMTYLVLGWSQIVGGLVSGLLLYVVGGIGQVVVELWDDRKATATND